MKLINMWKFAIKIDLEITVIKFIYNKIFAVNTLDILQSLKEELIKRSVDIKGCK